MAMISISKKYFSYIIVRGQFLLVEENPQLIKTSSHKW